MGHVEHTGVGFVSVPTYKARSIWLKCVFVAIFVCTRKEYRYGEGFLPI